MRDQIIYVLGEGYKVRSAWDNAHPRAKRANATLTLFNYVDLKRRTWLKWQGEHPPAAAPDDETDIASVFDLYDFIKDATPGSVVALHFFTHGIPGGPVLLNTWDLSGDPAARDPNDKDPRIKDFSIDTVLGGAEGSRFRAGFSSTALIKLWGCAYLPDFREMIQRDYYRAKTAADRATITSSYKDHIKDGTYQYHMSHALGIPVYAAPLGWGTNPYLPFDIQGKPADKAKPRQAGHWPPKKGDQWWRVSQYFRPDGGREFFRRELKAKLDILDYVAYNDALVRK